jgi:hypothetical protein
MMAICDVQGNKLKVEYSTTATAWDTAAGGGVTWPEVTDVTGFLDVTGGDKTVAEYKTFGKTVAAIDRSGVQNVQLDVLFENSTTSFLELMTDRWDGTTAGECFFLRWSYNEGAAGALRRTAEVALLTNPFTGGDANSAEPVRKRLTFATTEIHRDVVPA